MMDDKKSNSASHNSSPSKYNDEDEVLKGHNLNVLDRISDKNTNSYSMHPLASIYVSEDSQQKSRKLGLILLNIAFKNMLISVLLYSMRKNLDLNDASIMMIITFLSIIMGQIYKFINGIIKVYLDEKPFE